MPGGDFIETRPSTSSVNDLEKESEIEEIEMTFDSEENG